MDNLAELTSISLNEQGNLFHGARYYELPWLFPRANIPVSDSTKAPTDTESIRQSTLTQTIYFTRTPGIAAAYPMIDRRPDITSESPATLFPLGVILITDENLIRARGLTTEEINLIQQPDKGLLKHLRVADKPVHISAIKGVQLVLYTSSFETPRGQKEYMNILSGNVEDTEEEPTKHPEGLYHQLIQIKQRLRHAYPHISVRLTRDSLSPSIALDIIKST